jgi:hypothetical protein
VAVVRALGMKNEIFALVKHLHPFDTVLTGENLPAQRITRIAV